MLSRSRIATAVLSAGIVLSSCGFGAGRDDAYGLVVVPDLNRLDGDTVVADSIVDPDRQLVPGTEIRMSFTADSVSVNAGCNTLNGSTSIEDYELVVVEFASTLQACDEELEEQDQWLTAFLTSRPRFERVDDDVYLSRDDTVVHLVPGDS